MIWPGATDRARQFVSLGAWCPALLRQPSIASVVSPAAWRYVVYFCHLRANSVR